MSRPVLDLHDVWDEELERMSRVGAVEADVSALLGGPPEYCEEAEDATPALGLDLGTGPAGVAEIASVRDGGPADLAGLRVGMRIRGVAGEAVETAEDAVRSIRARAEVDRPLSIATSGRAHEVVQVVPTRRDALLGSRKCYWSPTHGSVGPPASSGGLGLGAGTAGAPGYRVACRFADGVLTVCASMHGEGRHRH